MQDWLIASYCRCLWTTSQLISVGFPLGLLHASHCTCLTFFFLSTSSSFWCFQAASRTPWLRLWGCCWSPWSWQLWLQRSSWTGDECASLVFSKLPERIDNCRVSSVKTFRGAMLSHSELQLKTTTPHLAQPATFGLISSRPACIALHAMTHSLLISSYRRHDVRFCSFQLSLVWTFAQILTFQASSFTMSHVQRVTTLWVASSFTTSAHVMKKKDSGTQRFVCVFAVGFGRRRCDLRRCFPPGRLRPGSAPRAHRVRLRATQIVSPPPAREPRPFATLSRKCSTI